MADMSMCLNHQCPSRKDCYRYTARANEFWQSYADYKPDGRGWCQSFWPNDLYKNSDTKAQQEDADE